MCIVLSCALSIQTHVNDYYGEDFISKQTQSDTSAGGSFIIHAAGLDFLGRP